MDNMDKKAQIKLSKKNKGNSCIILLLDALFCNTNRFFSVKLPFTVFQCLQSKNGDVCMQLL